MVYIDILNEGRNLGFGFHHIPVGVEEEGLLWLDYRHLYIFFVVPDLRHVAASNQSQNVLGYLRGSEARKVPFFVL